MTTTKTTYVLEFRDYFCLWSKDNTFNAFNDPEAMSKAMNDNNPNLTHVGLKYIGKGEEVLSRVFELIDEQLFFLSVIKYGITYEEWKGYME